MTIANCTHCGKVFRKTTQDACSDCFMVHQDLLREIRQHLQDSTEHGGIVIDELAELVGKPVKEIEDLFKDGTLGAASTLLKTSCKSCGLVVGEDQRRGYYCLNCCEEVAKKAGVESLTAEELEKREKEERAQAVLKSISGNRTGKQDNNSRYGLGRSR